jgi:hypothetical protein
MVFRGWYDFGGGSMADMGHYSLWTVFNALDLKSPTSIEPALTHTCGLRDGIAFQVQNDYSFPTASAVRFKYPASGTRPAVDLVWYDGGMRPPTPEELEANNEELPIEGMMFVGGKGKILSGFQLEDPQLISQGGAPKDMTAPAHVRGKQIAPSMRQWITAVRGGAQSPSSFLNAWPISEAVNLYAVALRTGKKLLYDGQSQKVTNLADADKYLVREYRKGWDPQAL